MSTLQVCFRGVIEGRWTLTEVGGHRWRQAEADRGGEMRLYHDITPLLCHYVLEQHSTSSTSEAVQGSWCGGRGGVWGIRVLEVEFLYSSWGMDLHVREPHVI